MRWSARFSLLVLIFFFLVSLGSAVVFYLSGGYYIFAVPAFLTITAVGSYASGIRSGWREWQRWGPQTIHFDDDGVTFQTKRASSRIPWSSFTRFVDRKEAYIPVTKWYSFSIILKRATPDDVKGRLHDMIASQRLGVDVLGGERTASGR
jgi:hypothetical protein